MKAFVTGSTGLLGSNLVNALVAAGYEVKALARSREKAEKLLRHSKVQIVVGDMENIPAFAAQMAGSDVLFHTAAYVREVFGPGNHWPKLEKINTGSLLMATSIRRYRCSLRPRNAGCAHLFCVSNQGRSSARPARI